MTTALNFILLDKRSYTYEDIVRLEADRNYTIMQLKNGRKILTSKTLGAYEESFPVNFMRVHKSHFINLKYVRMVRNWPERFLVLADGTEVPVARRRWREIKRFLSRGLS
jgi:two-component system, LytTR family, response regulator